MARYKTISQDNAGELMGADLIADPVIAERTRYSVCRKYRYTLFRYFGPDYEDKAMAFLCMNPSGADENSDDRTVAKCVRFARTWGFDGMYMLNAFALRATSPKELYAAADPVGKDNEYWISEILPQMRLVVVGWGRPGGDFARAASVEAILRNSLPPERIRCFSLNQDGTPVHPLYQRAEAPLRPYFREGADGANVPGPGPGGQKVSFGQ